MYFKMCKHKKSFQEIHAFANNLTAVKCDEAAEARSRSRSSSPRAVPAPAATGGTAPGAAAKQRAKRGRSPSRPARADEAQRRAARDPPRVLEPVPTTTPAPPVSAGTPAEPAGAVLTRLGVDTVDPSANCAVAQLLLRVAEATRSDGHLRKGKWPIAESDLTEAFIAQFGHRTLPLQPGAWLRLFIARVLNCDPDRITKKLSLIHI